MIPKIQQSDFGFYALRFFDGLGNVILPDLDASLIWEFRDSGNTLRLTATLISSPAIVQDSDSEGDFLKVSGIDISGWDIGMVIVSAFANVSGDPIQPDPLTAIAFEVAEDIFGYCSVQDVKDYSGVVFKDLDLTDENELDAVIGSWIAQATNYIDAFTKDTFLVSTPKGIEMVCMRIVSNMVHLAVQRKKSPLIQIADFNVQMLQDKVITKEMENVLTLYRKKTDATNADSIFAALVVLPEED